MSAQASYREFCRTAPDLPVFAQDWYLDACAEGGAWDVVLVREGDRIVAALPFFYKQRGPFRYATMPPFVKWLGPYVLPELRGHPRKENRLLQQLLEQLPPLAAFKQNFYPWAGNWLPFYWAGFKQTTYYTYRLRGLQDLRQIEAGVAADVRRNIRRARLTVRVLQQLPLATFFDVNSKSFARQGKAVPYSWEQLARHDEALARHDARRLFFAVDDEGQVHSVAYLIWDQHTAYYHLAGDDPALRGSGAGLLLVWEAIRYTSEVLGLDNFDFEGSMLPGVESVRVRFGASQTPYFFVWKYNSPWFEWLEKLKSL
jgi:hypothetical protein